MHTVQALVAAIAKGEGRDGQRGGGTEEDDDGLYWQVIAPPDPQGIFRDAFTDIEIGLGLQLDVQGDAFRRRYRPPR